MFKAHAKLSKFLKCIQTSNGNGFYNVLQQSVVIVCILCEHIHFKFVDVYFSRL